MGSYTWVLSRVTILIIHIRGLITPLITTHEPSSMSCQELREQIAMTDNLRCLDL